MTLIRTEAIVIGVRDLGEADRIVTLLSATDGKRRAVARGARRPRSRLAAGTQLFIRAAYLLSPGRELDSISQAEIRGVFPRIGADLLKTAAGACMCETAGGLTAEREPAPDMYRLLDAALTVLDRGADPITVLCRFLVRAVTAAGFSPVLDRCAVCGSDPNSPVFSHQAGGLACTTCARGVLLTEGMIEALRCLAGNERQVTIDVGVRQQVLRLLQDYAEQCLETPLRSAGFLRQIIGDGGGNGNAND